MKYRSMYDSYDSNNYGLLLDDESITQQHCKDECDVNKILEKWLRTGSIEHVQKRAATYADVSQVPTDYATAFDVVSKADDSFMSLPAKVRKRFKNDPGAFLDWMSQDTDMDEKVALGLLKREIEPVQVVESASIEKTDDL